jgi:GGDEF domain-containing protein
MVAKLCLLSAMAWREKSAENYGNQDDYFIEAISVGVAVWQKDFLSQDDLMAAASALYEAKEAG